MPGHISKCHLHTGRFLGSLFCFIGLFATLHHLIFSFVFLNSEYDIYGFRTVPEDDEEEKLVAKVRALDLKTLYLTENQEVSTGVKWENYFASTVNREMMCSPELKNLIRAGIPHEHRSKVWKWCVDLHTRKFKDSIKPGYFQTLLQKALEKQNPASKQIELDLLRTLPNNKHYSCPTSEGIQKLRNVLLAFSWRNPDIGYCQGLNRWVPGPRGLLSAVKITCSSGRCLTAPSPPGEPRKTSLLREININSCSKLVLIMQYPQF